MFRPRNGPGGTQDNSPTFQSWGPRRHIHQVPKARPSFETAASEISNLNSGPPHAQRPRNDCALSPIRVPSSAFGPPSSVPAQYHFVPSILLFVLCSPHLSRGARKRRPLVGTRSTRVPFFVQRGHSNSWNPKTCGSRCSALPAKELREEACLRRLGIGEDPLESMAPHLRLGPVSPPGESHARFDLAQIHDLKVIGQAQCKRT